MTDPARSDARATAARPGQAWPAAARANVDFRGLLTRSDVESPPDEHPMPPWPPFGEPAVIPETQTAAEEDPEPAERTIVVYERKSRGLLIFTALMVALTVGVILGQTSAFEESSAAPRTEPVGAGYSTPPEPSAAAPSAPTPVPGTRISAPIGTARDHSFEVGGGAALVTIRSADLGDKLYDIATFDGSAVPQMVGGTRLELVRTGTAGRIGADIQLNSAVRWKLRLDGGTAEQDIDMSRGHLTGLEVTGGASRVVLRLPTPKGTIPIKLDGGASEFDVQAAAPVRVRLGKGADDAVIGGTTRHAVKAGTILTGSGWKNTTNRYDVTATAKLNLVRVTAAPRVPPSAPPPSARSAPPTPSASTASTTGHPGGARA
jgi:hypothetical protein